MAALAGLRTVVLRDLSSQDRGEVPAPIEDTTEAGWEEFESLRSRFHRPNRIAPAATMPVPRRVAQAPGRFVAQPTAELVYALAQVNDRVCPTPSVWEKFYQRLPVEHCGLQVVRAPFPIERRRWDSVSDEEKAQRLREQLAWAEERGGLYAVQRFLHEMDEAEWHHRPALVWPTLEW